MAYAKDWLTPTSTSTSGVAPPANQFERATSPTLVDAVKTPSTPDSAIGAKRLFAQYAADFTTTNTATNTATDAAKRHRSTTAGNEENTATDADDELVGIETTKRVLGYLNNKEMLQLACTSRAFYKLVGEGFEKVRTNTTSIAPYILSPA